MKTYLNIFTTMILMFFSNNVFADAITCNLKSGQDTQAATINLSETEQDGYVDEYAVSDAVYDLNFIMTASCEEKECLIDITLDSGILESEVGSTAFEFTRSGKNRELLREAITGAPDKRNYEIYCNYNKQTTHLQTMNGSPRKT